MPYSVRRLRAVLVVLVVGAMPLSLSAQGATPVDWGTLGQLVGHWVADSGDGHPGVATRAGETFTLELDDHILVRHDFSEYAGAGGAQGTRHEGLLVIFPTGPGSFAAHSYDNEGHLIDYAVATSAAAITLTSAPASGAPRFRLTYVPTNGGMRIRFEIAPPGQPDAFQQYVSGTTHRVP